MSSTPSHGDFQLSEAVTKQAKSRQDAMISRVERTICRTFPRIMPDFAGIYRPNDRPKRHANRPELEAVKKQDIKSTYSFSL